jgi:hypothetical protein
MIIDKSATAIVNLINGVPEIYVLAYMIQMNDGTDTSLPLL